MEPSGSNRSRGCWIGAAHTAPAEPCPVFVGLVQSVVRGLVQGRHVSFFELWGTEKPDHPVLGAEIDAKVATGDRLDVEGDMYPLPGLGHYKAGKHLSPVKNIERGLLFGRAITPERKAVTLARVFLRPCFFLAKQGPAANGKQDVFTDTARRVGRKADDRRGKITVQRIEDTVLVNTSGVESAAEAALVTGGQRTGHMDVPRGVETLEVSPVTLQHAEQRVGNSRDTSDTDFGGFGKGGKVF